ncbi:ABC transporter substrate-binding protein [Patescibacteria group bacterium]
MASPLTKRIQILIWISKAFISKHAKLLILSLVLGIGGFLIVFKLLPYLPEPKKHYRIGLVGKFSLDQLPQDIEGKLSRGLTSVNEEGLPIPDVAEDWEISDDGLTYTFSLKNNVYWQDGALLKAQDISYSFKDVEVNPLSEDILTFKLKEPYTPFLVALGKPIFKDNLVGTGKYHIERLKKSGDYLEAITIDSKDNKITYKFYPTLEMATLSFQLGEIDILDNLFTNPLDESWDKFIKVEELVKKDRYIALFFNNTDNFLGSKEFRQGLAYALLVKPDDNSRAYGPLNPNSWAYNSDIKEYNYDEEKAKNIFEKFTKDNEEINIRISTSESFLSLAEEIKKDWERVLGIKVSVELINAFTSDYQVFLGIQEIPIDPDQYSLWHSTAIENITNFNDPRVDKLLEDGRKITNLDTRKEKYADFQRFLLEESPVAFLFYPSIYKISRSTVGSP